MESQDVGEPLAVSAGLGMHLPGGSTFAPFPVRLVIIFHILKSHVTLSNLTSQLDSLQRQDSSSFSKVSSPDAGPAIMCWSLREAMWLDLIKSFQWPDEVSD